MRTRSLLASALIAALLGPAGQADATAAPWLAPPLDSTISRYFQAPVGEWGSGHRGIDYAVMPGAQVRAAAPGIVTFAGPVAGVLAVTIDHTDGLETTYSQLSEIHVSRGEGVGEGRFVGAAGRSHTGQSSGLHFGVKLDDRYVDPLEFMGPVDMGAALHLAPLARTHAGAGEREEPCRHPAQLSERPPPPNRNIAVAIAGLNSATSSSTPDLYARAFGPSALGYGSDDIYFFSYRGAQGPRFHERYERSDTYGDILVAAGRLRDLLVSIGRRHPGRRIDLLTHSQGGVVARAMLEGMTRAWDSRIPPVDHLITLATPHRGAPLAEAIADLRTHTQTGARMLRRISVWSERGGPVPDPGARAITQLAPRSELMRWLATEDSSYGTRALSLAGVTDVIVPSSSAMYRGQSNRIVSPPLLDAHDAIVRSRAAQAYAYAFLRNGPDSCVTAWDRFGAVAGPAIDFAERHAGDVYGAFERLGQAAGTMARGGANIVGVMMGWGWLGL